MPWQHLVSLFFGGALLSNAVPHFVGGVMGESFQSPFAKPPGKGLSSSTVNVVWGVANLAVGYVLVCRAGDINMQNTVDVVALGLGVLVMSLHSARHFGQFHGGRAPERS